MHRRFDHENLKVYQMGVTFCGWRTPLLEGIATRVAAKDQLDRASTSIVLNIAEGNGKRSYRDRSRYFDIARGSGVESAACLDVLVARGVVEVSEAKRGKEQLFEIVSMIGGLLARFAGDGRVEEEQAEYGIDKEKVKE
tara:strand:+ start:179 stop:595 length:417 start_codon:yes stop_codon:yes gene_type:complete